MSDISQWSKSAAGNAVATPNGWPAAQAPSTVKDVGREMMAATRRQFEDEPWFNWGDTSASNSLAFISATTFKLGGDARGRYLVNRRLRLNDGDGVGGTLTLYGSVTDSTFTSDTKVTVKLDSGVLSASLSSVALSNTTPLGMPSSAEQGDNLLINGDGVVSQRGTTFTAALPATGGNSDGAITLDKWKLLSDGADVLDVSQETTTANLPTGARAAIKWEVTTLGASKQAGMLQMIENKDTIQAVGGIVSFSFKAKAASQTNLDKLRAGIIAWSGAADAITSDIVQSWPGVEGTDPTLSSGSSAYLNTPSDLALTTSYKPFRVEAVAVPAGTINLGVFVWIDNIDAVAGEIVYLTDFQLNIGGTVAPFEVRPVAQELELCKRYYEKSYELAAAPGTVTKAGEALQSVQMNTDGSSIFYTPKNFEINFQCEKHSTPTVVVYSPKSSTAGLMNNTVYDGTTEHFTGDLTVSTAYPTITTTAKNAVYQTDSKAELATYTASLGKYYNGAVRFQYTAEAEIYA